VKRKENMYEANIFNENYVMLKLIAIMMKLGLRRPEYSIIEKAPSLYNILIDNYFITNLRNILAISLEIHELRNHSFLNYSKLNFKLELISFDTNHYIGYRKTRLTKLYHDKIACKLSEDLYERKKKYVGTYIRMKLSQK
jgi:hypothetical protein